MAVQPQYQWIAEHQMVKSHIGVITNVRPDHLEEMGPTEDDVAYSLSNTIPIGGIFITGEDQKPELLKSISKQNKSKFIRSDETSITKKELESFSYLEHPSNIAVALDVCKQAGVERGIALAGMHKVQPDVGALIVWTLSSGEKIFKFINGMAANDPVSTLQIWKVISDRYSSDKESCVFFNSRDDRPVRTKQMIELTLKDIKPKNFIIRGDKLDNIIGKFSHYSPSTNIQTLSLNESIKTSIALIKKLPNNTLIYAIGNQVGVGQTLLESISELKYNG